MLENKVILVTGASGEIGSDFVKYACDNGAVVYASGRDEEKLNSLCGYNPERVHGVSSDLTEADGVERVFDRIQNDDVKLDAMVYCAGVTETVPLRALSAEDMEDEMRVNTIAFVKMVQFFARKKYSVDGAAVAALSSLASFTLDKGMLSYAASKSAMNASVTVLAKELAGRKMRVNAVAPGNVDTEMFRLAAEMTGAGENPEMEAQPFGVIPVRQISYLLSFLVSEQSKYITGAVIPVSGARF